mgnify:CR=1 FL=1
MRIDSAGNVGIGTTNPASILHVEAATPTVTVKGTSTASSKVNLINGSVTWSLENQYVGGATTNMFRIFNSSLGADALTIHRANNNVGIGTTNPLGKLHVRSANAGSFTYDSTADDFIVESNANGGMTIATAAANTSRIIFASPDDPTGGEISFNQTAKLMKIGPTTANGLLALQSANGVETMRLDASNRVGIGTTSPSYKLSVSAVSYTHLTLPTTD